VQTELIIGPPGTGKTTTLLEIVDQEISQGTEEHRIAFLSFTRKAAEEARRRCNIKNPPYFRTLHSFAKDRLGLGLEEIFSGDAAKRFAEEQHLEFRNTNFFADPSYQQGGEGDTVMHVADMMSGTRRSLNEVYEEVRPRMRYPVLQQHLKKLDLYKKKNGLFGFSDMLVEFLHCEDIPELDVLIIDEAQDLTALQWDVFRHTAASSGAKRCWIAGDDDQAIYTWVGADVDHFISIGSKHRVLGQSYRVPSKIQAVADRVISAVGRREKKWRARPEEGLVRRHETLRSVDLEEGEWLVLSRNNCFLTSVADELKRMGRLFRVRDDWAVPRKYILAAKFWESYRLTRDQSDWDKSTRGMSRRKSDLLIDSDPSEVPWEDALDKIAIGDRSLVRQCLATGEGIDGPPRITLSSIHRTKGGESQKVLLITDITKSVADAMNRGTKWRDAEHRTFYVGVTRAREELHLLHLGSPHFFQGLID